MPTNTFNIGRDCSLVVVAGGFRFDFSLVTGFNAKQGVHSVRVRPLNGPPIGADVPDGWTGSFGIDRASSGADDFFSRVEAGFWAGANLTTGQIYQYVQEVDGSTSTYLFDGVTMHLSAAGDWKQEQEVKQTIDFFASVRRRV